MATQRESIEEAIQVIRENIEIRVAERTQQIIETEIENVLKQEFIDSLTHKVEQIGEVVGQDHCENFINFGCEIPKIDPADTKIARQLINIIDEINLDFFFKREPPNLHMFKFCSKYFMFSQYCDKRQVNLINFNWSKNKFEPNQICYCFMCKFNLQLVEEQREKANKVKADKEKADKETNDN